MTTHDRVRPAADADLDDHAAYLAREAGLDIARRFYDAAATTFEQIARMPGIGDRRPTANTRLEGLRVSRIQGFEKHLIFYPPVPDGIEIVRVLHGARDLDRLLESET